MYPLRAFLPSQRDLAEEFDVSRDTVQRVLRELAEQGWIESRQGSGSRVVRVPRIQPLAVSGGRLRGGVTLGPLLAEAFERDEVTLDVYSLTSESLDAHLRVQAERIHSGAIRPERISLRLILPSEDIGVPYPRVKDDPDDPRPNERLHGITRRSTSSVHELFRGLEALVPTPELEIRRAPLTPTCKIYLLNGTDALVAPYQVIEREATFVPGEKVDLLDVLGFGAPLTHHVKDTDPNSPGTVFVDTWQAWFDSVWSHLAE